MTRRLTIGALAILAALAMTVILFAAPGGEPVAQAQGDSEAVFTVEETTFESHYPRGMTFTIDAESSAGEIVRGTLFIELRTGLAERYAAELNMESGVWQTCPYCLRGGLPPWVDFHYYWLLADDAGNTFETEPAYGIYEDNTREWFVLDRDDITLYWFGYDEEFGEHMAAAMEQYSANMEVAWGRTISYTPLAIMFPDGQVWNEYVEGGVNPNAAGFTDSSTGFTVLRPATAGDPVNHEARRTLCGGYWYGDRDNTPEEWAREDTLHTVLHEFTHLYQADFRLRGPFWWTEGQADFFANAALPWRNRDSDGRMMNWGAQGYDLITLQGGGPGGGSTTSADGCHALGYAVGDSFIRWFTDSYGGLEIHRAVLENVAGNGVEAALEIATGLSFNEIENQYRAAFGIAPVAVVPTPTMFAFPTAPIPSVPTSPANGS